MTDAGADLTRYWVVMTSVLIAAAGIYGIIADGRRYSLAQMFYLFVAVFLGIAPLLQFLNGVSLWTKNPFSASDYLRMNVMLLACLAIYMLMSRMFGLRRARSVQDKPITGRVYTDNALLWMSAIAMAVTVAAYRGDVVSMLWRGWAQNTPIGRAAPVMGVPLTFVPEAVVAVSLMLFKLGGSGRRRTEVILAVLTLLANWPMAVPRFQVAAVYVPLLLIYVPAVRRKYVLVSALFVLLLAVFPLMNLFRRDFTGFGVGNFLTADYDTFQNMLEAVRGGLVTGGRQMLGVVLFFVPRAVWPGKPVGSGFYVAGEYGYDYDNIAMCLFGEGYVNFGFTGMILVSVMIAWVNARADSHYWGGRGSGVFNVCYLMGLPMEFVILRGALMNMLPYYLAYIVVTYIVARLSVRYAR